MTEPKTEDEYILRWKIQKVKYSDQLMALAECRNPHLISKEDQLNPIIDEYGKKAIDFCEYEDDLYKCYRDNISDKKKFENMYLSKIIRRYKFKFEYDEEDMKIYEKLKKLDNNQLKKCFVRFFNYAGQKSDAQLYESDLDTFTSTFRYYGILNIMSNDERKFFFFYPNPCISNKKIKRH